MMKIPEPSCPPEWYYEATILHMLCLCCPCWYLAACRGVMPGSSKERNSWCVVYNIRPWAGLHGDRTSLRSDSWRGSLPHDVRESILKDSVRKQRPRGDSFSCANVLTFLLYACPQHSRDRVLDTVGLTTYTLVKAQSVWKIVWQ